MRILAFLILATPGFAQQPSVDAIMARVAINQDQSQAERAHFLYVQHAHVTSRSGKTIRCEETTDTRMAPTETGYSGQLLKLDGRVLRQHHYVTYNQLSPSKNVDVDKSKVDKSDDGLKITVSSDDQEALDRDLVEEMRDDLTREKTKDGIGAGLFPLTTKTQANYAFRLVGLEHLNGHQVFHIVFSPRENNDATWKGDAYIDTSAYEPVVVRTELSHKVPFAVRTLLGTNLPNLGFTVIYAPEPSDKEGAVWFPTNFGTEFKLRVLFFFNREITLNVENREFERTHVTSKILTAVQAAP